MKANHNWNRNFKIDFLLVMNCQRYKMKANHNNFAKRWFCCRLVMNCQRYKMKANHNLVFLLVLNRLLVMNCQRYKMKANHNSRARQKKSLLAGYELSKIQNESESQPVNSATTTTTSWL